MNIIIDNEFKNLLHPLQIEEKQQLEKSILDEGCRDALVLWNDILIDGHNRYEICIQHNIKFETVQKDFDNRTEVMIWIINNQLGRRNSSKHQQDYSLGKRYELEKKRITNKSGVNQYTEVKGQNDPQPTTAQKIAEENKVSEKTVKRAATFAKAIDILGDNLGDEVKQTLLSKDSPLNKTEIEKVSKEKPEEQTKIINLVLSGKSDNVKQAKKQLERQRKLEERKKLTPDLPMDSPVWHGDFREQGKKIPDNSVDLIFTDPPYGQEYLELYRNLGIFANRVLKPGGLCLVYSGQAYLPEKINYLGENLEYVWCFAIQHSGQRTQIYYRNVSNVWKPVLAYGKLPLDIWWKTMPDMQTGHQEKTSHAWQQSLNEAEFYIKNLCPESGLVVDPFCGSGTTLVAAKRLGLKYIGIEEDLEDCQKAVERLND